MMNVQQLIDELEKMPKHFFVKLEVQPEDAYPERADLDEVKQEAGVVALKA